MRNLKICGVIFLMMAFLCSRQLSAQYATNWQMLGVREVNFRVDRDVIRVSSQKGIYKALKLKVNLGSINMHRFFVFFGNGTSQELRIRKVIQKGGETRVLDLAGNKRVISRVEFLFDTKNYANRKAIVQLWGLH